LALQLTSSVKLDIKIAINTQGNYCKALFIVFTTGFVLEMVHVQIRGGVPIGIGPPTRGGGALFSGPPRARKRGSLISNINVMTTQAYVRLLISSIVLIRGF